MNDIFISYRRIGGGNYARDLYNDLNKRGYSLFWDIESMQSGHFKQQIFDVIDNAKDVIVVLSKGALEPRTEDSEDFMRMEIAHAFKAGKNIITYMAPDFTFPKELPEDIDKIRYMHGVVDNFEFHNEVIDDRLRKLLISKPFGGVRRIRALVIAAAIAVALCVSAALFLPGILNKPAAPAGAVAEATIAAEEPDLSAMTDDERTVYLLTNESESRDLAEGEKTVNCVCRHELYDANRILLADGFFDSEGALAFNENARYACRLLAYDDADRLLEERFLDAELAPVNCAYLDARVTYEYDAEGRLSRQSFFGADGDPCMTADGFSIVLFEYDENSYLQTKTFLDADERPVDTAYGFAREIYGYNAEGKVNSTRQLSAQEVEAEM